MARRSMRGSSRPRPPARGFANKLRGLPPDALKSIGEALRSATKQIIQELQEEGPNYSGEFKSKWYSQVEGRAGKVYASTGVPRFTEEQLKKGAPAILIGNSSPHAQEAMDLIPGDFKSQEEDPNKAPVAMGRRVGKERGDVKDLPSEEVEDMYATGRRPAISTAEKDWFTTYMEGGSFGRAFRQGAKSGFINVKRK